MLTSKTPLALKNLVHSPRRLLVAVAGIAFAVVLIFSQIGFQNALFDSTVKIIADLDADLVLASRALYALPAAQRFSSRRIYQARACPGVADVYPVYLETFYGVWRPAEGKSHPIRTIAFDPDDPVFLIPGVQRHTEALRQPKTAIIDAKSKAKYRIPDTLAEVRNVQGTELSDRSIKLVGTFRMGTDFANDGNLIMSASNFAAYFPHRAGRDDPLSLVDLGVVKLDREADAHEVIERLRRTLPDDVAVDTKAEFIRKEMEFWANSAPIGYIFQTGTVMAFIVGVVICYQVIYSGIADTMSELATLKAMGYPDRYFVRFVLETSFYLSVLSYVPGLAISIGLYAALAEYTGLLMIMNVPRAALVFALTLAMCFTSGCFAVRKVLAADAADLF